MIGVIKYRAGNLTSVSNALERLGAEFDVTDRTERLDRCDAIIFPGVGHAASAMEDLRERGLDRWLRETRKPVLGICLGMQLFYETSEEGEIPMLGIVPGRLRKFDDSAGKVPHMGWNRFTQIDTHPLLDGITRDLYFYFVHGYHAPPGPHTVAVCNYINDFTAAVARDNFMGVQFHPEKSGRSGARILRNFLEIVRLHAGRH